eukprot:m.88639 g.88639  ORF g.88639 m.88639 type:complete len:862 (+) comp13179_c0_seq3:173-2758(+)
MRWVNMSLTVIAVVFTIIGEAMATTPDASCTVIKGVDFGGGPGVDIKSVTVSSSGDCCQACANFSICTAWSWNGPPGNSGCYMKTTDSGPRSNVSYVVSGTVDGRPQPPQPKPCTTCPWLNPNLSTDQRVADLVAALTINEKISLLSTTSPAIERLKLPAYAWWSEGAHGVAWAGVATVFPALVGLGSSFDVEGMQEVGEAIGMEGRAKHNDYIAKHNGTSDTFYGLDFFAPNINIVRDIRWGRGQETFGEDPHLTARLGVPLIRGLQGNTSATDSYPLAGATAKHFFGYNLESNFAPSNLFPNGGTDGQYRLHANLNITETDLRQTYLPAFDAAVTKGQVRSIMCSYNSVNGIPACAHPMIDSELRQRSNFSGYVVSDCGAIGWMGPTQHNYTSGDPESTAAGLHAGCDMDCGGAYGNGAMDALNSGEITEADIDKALSRTLYARISMGLLDPPGVNPYQKISMDVVDSQKHRALALRMATESIVLLKNKNILPIKATAKIAVIGPNANRTMTLLSNYPGCKTSPGGSIDPQCNLVNPLQGLSAAAKAGGGSVSFEQGCEIDGDDESQIPAAVAAAKASDVAIVVGGIITCQETGQYCQEAEAKDRVNITLPGKQLDLLKAVSAVAPTVLVIMSGSTVSVPWAAQNVDGILQLWYPGEEGGTALANIVYGKENPSGRMSETVFTGIEQLPPNYLNLTMSEPPGRTHRYFTETPLYAFGFGLSYSDRGYSNLKLSKNTLKSDGDSMTLSVDLTCKSGPPGTEVTQVYTSLQIPPSKQQGNQSIPVRELKDFTRTTFSSCTGSTVTVHFTLSTEDLALVDVDGSVTAIKGSYKVWVGSTGPAPLGTFVEGVDSPLEAQFSVM